MHDAAHKYEPNTIVWDLDEQSTQPIAIGRASTEDLVAQVNVMGKWHRRTPDLKETACGVPYHSQFAPTRREELCNPLCNDCFTAHEQSIANIRDIEEGER